MDEVEEGGEVEGEEGSGVGEQVIVSEGEEAIGGIDAGGVFEVVGMEEVFLEVDEGAGDLDEGFVEVGGGGVFGLEPEGFEDVVGFVVELLLEKGEVGAEFGG